MPDKTEQLFCIWSREQGRWWKPAGCGYTFVPREAGRYNYSSAMTCMSTSKLDVNGEPEDSLVPWEIVKSWLAEEGKRLEALTNNMIETLRKSGWNDQQIKESLDRMIAQRMEGKFDAPRKDSP